MAERCISYVCVRAEHHRRQSRVLRLTTHKECCAFCPAGAAEGHEWLSVPEVTLATFEGVGWISKGSARRCSERSSAVEERELVTAGA